MKQEGKGGVSESCEKEAGKGWSGSRSDSRISTSLVTQWLRICLAMHGMQVQSLVGELKSHMP